MSRLYGKGRTATGTYDARPPVSTAASSTWAQVLVNGNTSGGRNPTISSGDAIQGADGPTGVTLSLRGGNSSDVGASGGGVNVSAGTPADGNGGSVSISASSGVGIDRSGGDITLTPGAKTGAGTPGALLFKDSAGVTVIQCDTGGIGFFGAAPVQRVSVTGSRGNGQAFQSLLAALGATGLGLITDNSTP